MSSLKASVDRITGLQKLTNQKPLPGNNANKFWGIVFPVIVVDGLLFECSISDEGTIAIGETDISVLHWKGQLPIPSSPDIFIVTKRSIDGFVRLASKTADGLIDTVPK